MIIPVAVTKSGKTETIGTASVYPQGNDFSVTFYLKPGYALSDQAKSDVEKQLRDLARRKS